mgnify:CR=1 FL=1
MDEDDDIIDPQNFIESVDIELEPGESDDDIDMGIEEHIVENMEDINVFKKNIFLKKKIINLQK